MTDKHYDVIVVGAGLIGSAMALLLAQRSQHRVAVVEQAPFINNNPSPNQRVVALGKAATSLLDEVGVFSELRPQFCHAYEKMFIWDQHSDGELTFSASDYSQPELGHLIDSMQCTMLLQAGMNELENIDVFYNYTATSIDFGKLEQGSIATLNSSDLTLTARLIVAADGGRSWIRQRAKIFSTVLDYKQRGIVAKINTALPHHDTAWQRFLETGPLAVLPLAENQSSIVWSADNRYADELMAKGDHDFEAALGKALDGRLGEIDLLSKRAVFPLQSQQAERYFKHRLALIGDAAHSIHPLAGQGANLGFKDVSSLVQTIAKLGSRQLGDLDVLEKYQRSRKLDNQQTDLLMSSLYKAYQNNAPWWLAARGLGMDFLSGSGSLKQLLVKQAMGI